jgi:hypothetical protein
MKGTRVEWPEGLLKPGEYAKGPDGNWYGMTPNEHLAGLAKHDITENPDGTLTVSPSIAVWEGNIMVWHGYLENGVWREV